MKAAYVLSICLLLGLCFGTDVLAARDKGLIVWSSNRFTRPEGVAPDTNLDLWVMRANEGKDQVRITEDPPDNPKDEEEPAWSPNGRRIAFTSNRDGRDDIFIMDVDLDSSGK